MSSNSNFQVIRNEDFDIHLEKKQKYINKKVHLIRLSVFVVLIFSVFAGIFFIKDRIENIRTSQENLNFQKQKLAEERLSMEKLFKEEQEKLLKLQLEYEEKNKEVTETLNSIKVKEENLNLELLRVEELKDFLKKQLVDIYSFNVDKEYNGKINDNESNNINSGLMDDETVEQSIHTNIVVGDVAKNDELYDYDKILSVANADWFIKFDSLGEFSY